MYQRITCPCGHTWAGLYVRRIHADQMRERVRSVRRSLRRACANCRSAGQPTPQEDLTHED